MGIGNPIKEMTALLQHYDEKIAPKLSFPEGVNPRQHRNEFILRNALIQASFSDDKRYRMAIMDFALGSVKECD